MTRAGIVTCLELPEPDPDQDLLIEALSAAGADPVLVAWDDPSVRYGDLDVAVIRSTWNYHLHRDDFLAWANRTAEETRLVNPPEVIRWSSHKRYLADLTARGFHVVPTEFLERGATADLGEISRRRGWGDVVIKPAVSAGSFETHRIDAGRSGQSSDRGGADRQRERSGDLILSRMVAERDAMVQPYVGSVDEYGERSMIIIDGELTHAVRKAPRFAGGHEQVSGAIPIADDERALALSIWSALPSGLLYGRVDLARDDRGEPMVMELELIEPSLFFVQNPAALDRFVSALLGEKAAV